jgi:hypothetical protein
MTPTSHGGRLRSPSTHSSNAVKAVSAMAVCDICTVVNGGIMNWARRISSNPTTDKSRGTSSDSSNACRITPIAVRSLEQTTAEGGFARQPEQT